MKFLLTLFIALVLSVELFAPSFVQAQGTLYVSNLGQTPNGSEAIGSDSWLAQVFSTGTNSGGYVLNSVQLLMGAASGSPSGFSVSIYGSLNPTNSLGNLSGPDPSAGGIFTYAASGLDLSPSTTYFVVVTAATPVAQGAYNWSAGTQYTFGGNQWEIAATYFSSSDGLTWTGHGRSDAFQMAIYATAVPEPSVAGLLGLGGLGFLWHRRKAKAAL
jgi:hypothetical protein